MIRIVLHITLVIATCTPLVLLVTNMVQKYSLDGALVSISFLDAAMLVSAMSLPLCALSRLGVNWRTKPEEN